MVNSIEPSELDQIISSCWNFRDAVVRYCQVDLYRAKAVFDRHKTAVQKLPSHTRQRRMVEQLDEAMQAVYQLYCPGMAIKTPMLTRASAKEKNFRKFCRDLERSREFVDEIRDMVFRQSGEES